MHLAPPTQALCEKSLNKPPCAAAHGGWGFDGRRPAVLTTGAQQAVGHRAWQNPISGS
ncbi:hypothetical protein BSE24067_01168 [Burkholderia seminalis]|nr:hypothetical protein BSE24067_01168 [Burkholderia seminalis]